MKPMMLTLCIVAAACSTVEPPISPSTATERPRSQTPATPAQTKAQHGSELPFHGSFTGQTSGVVNCPPICPPTILTVTGSEEGSATHLGRFTAAVTERVDIGSTIGSGTIHFTAANGDRLFATTAGQEDGFTPPNISSISQVCTITGGTGRFDGATGTFIVRFIQVIDFETATASLSGSFEGQISLDD